MNFPLPYNKVLPHDIKLTRTPDYHKKDDICDKVVGSLVGLAIGDALGASVEFRPQKYLAANPIRKMEGGGTWGLDAGKWTDDTSMALCLASSLITKNGFNPYDQMVRYKWWHKHGYLSSTGHCFDIGQATRQSIKEFSLRQKILKTNYRCRTELEVDKLEWDSVELIKNFNVYCGSEGSAGNGALMRLAPVPLFFFKTPEIGITYAGLSASLTHANRKAVDACRYYAALIIGALCGFSKDQLLDKDFYSTHKSWFGNEPLDEDILLISRGSYQKDKKKDGYKQGIRGKGYIVSALEAALWAFWSDGDSFKNGALAAVNLGDDTDTTAAIYGQLAGAYYGYKNIPEEWVNKLYAREFIVCIGEWLHFGGIQRGLENREHQHTSSMSIPTEISKSSEEKQQQNAAASSISQPDNSTVYETDNKYNNHTRYSKQESTSNESNPTLNDDHHSPPLSSATNISAPPITPSSDVLSKLSGFSPAEKYNPSDDFTIRGHEHPFYRNS